MKRILAMLCVIACLFALAAPALAAGNITVYVKAPADWAEVNLYVWDSKDQALAGWPGTVMVKGADGWWSLEIPAGYVNVIANNGMDKPQTVDLKMDGNANAWITVNEDTGDGKHFNGTVYTDAACTKPFGGNSGNDNNNSGSASTPVDLSGLSSLAVVGGGIPGIGSWNPGDPAGDMTKASNGVYTKVIAVTAGAAMEIKIAGNDTWDDNYNFGPAENGTPITLGTKLEMVNGAGAQNFALTATKDCNLKFTVDLTGTAPTLLVEETDEEASTTPSTPGTDVPSGETYTVYAKVPDGWSDVRIWCWDNNSSNPANQGDWPGNFAMTKGANGWYSVEIPVGYNNVLVNGNGGGVQTPDIVGLDGTKDVWINAYTDVTAPVFAYEEIIDIAGPAETDPPTAPTRVTIPPTQPEADEGNNGGSDNTVLLCIIGSVVIIAVAAVVFIILKKKQQA